MRLPFMLNHPNGLERAWAAPVLRTWLPVAVLCAIAIALRWPDPQRFLEYDEVIAILFARQDFPDIVRATAADTMPPLYYWLLHLWHPAGDNLVTARLLSTLLGSAGVPTLYLLGRRLAGRTEALGAATLFAIAPFPVFYGHYTRMYALLTLLGLLATLFFVRWLQEHRARDLAFFTAAAALSLYVHNLAPLLILALDVLFLLHLPLRGAPTATLGILTLRASGQAPEASGGAAPQPPDPSLRLRVTGAGQDPQKLGSPALRRQFGHLALAHAALLLAYLPWLTYLPGQLEKVTRAFWIPPPGLTELVRTPLVFLFHLPLPDALLVPAAFVALLCLAVTIAETMRRWRQEPAERPHILVQAGVAALPIGLMFLISQVRPVYVERAVMVSAAAYYLLLAGALRRLPIRPFAYTLVAAVILMIAAAHGYQLGYERFPRSPYYALAENLKDQVPTQDLVLHDNKLSYFPTYFFAPDLRQAYLPDPPGSDNDTLAQGTIDVIGLPPVDLRQAVAGQRRVLFVIYRRALEEADAAGRPHPNKSWLDQRYRSELRTQIGDLHVYVYYVGTL